MKTGLTEEEAYVYVIETNLMQRSFSDLTISEKAAVLKARYEKESCQGRQNDILEEIARLEGKEMVTSGHADHKLPLSEGGTHDQSNLISLCKSCHSVIHANNGRFQGRR